ncbi:MAG: hypothetical protein DIU68_008875 [Chloroflexota bacterium]|nr:MAG: hypothetical protein DIU68_14845 [Chloroflexota bacterium]
MNRPALEYRHSIPLRHGGDCTLLGIGPGPTLYAEEFYGPGLMAQYAFHADGTLIACVDEGDASGADIRPLELPPDLVRSQPGWHTMSLNFAGPRHRGLAGPERLLDIVQPLSLQDKIHLIERFGLELTPVQLLGLAESYVLAEAPLMFPDVFVIARRIRVAFRMDEVREDEDGQPYDYDSVALYLAEIIDRRIERPQWLPEGEATLPGVQLHRPMDCIVSGNLLVIADGGEESRASQLHLWNITRPEPARPDDELLRKLYG